MLKFFGGKGGKDKAPTTGEAIQGLREQEEMLQKKSDFLEKKVDQQLTIAKQNAKTNKRKALQALKTKKRIEQQLQQIDGTLTTIEQQRYVLENANTNTEVLKNMGQAAKALKDAHKNMDVDQVRYCYYRLKIMGDIFYEQNHVFSTESQYFSRFTI